MFVSQYTVWGKSAVITKTHFIVEDNSEFIRVYLNGDVTLTIVVFEVRLRFGWRRRTSTLKYKFQSELANTIQY